jgi:hypothetical protein
VSRPFPCQQIGPIVVAASVSLTALASPAMAQQYTAFTDDFESYKTGKGLPTGGGNLWSSTNGNVSVEQGSASQFMWAHSAKGPDATTATFRATGISGTLSFDLRYTGDDGDTTFNETLSDNGITFSEFESSADDITVAYSTNGSTFTALQTFAWNSTTYRNGFASVSITLPTAALVSTLRIQFNQGPNTGKKAKDEWALDNVLVTVTTPEPATWSLFGVAAAALGFGVVRRRGERRSEERRRAPEPHRAREGPPDPG